MRQALFGVLLWLAGTLQALAGDVAPGLSGIAGDRGGRLMGFNRGEVNSLWEFEGEVWKKKPVNLPGGRGSPQVLLALRSGGFVSLWSTEKNRWALVWPGAGQVGEFEWERDGRPLLREDATGALWITGASPRVLRCEASGKTKAFDLSEHGTQPNHPKWNEVRFFPDAAGGSWLYTANSAGNRNGLAFPIKISGDNLVLSPVPPGAPCRNVLQIEPHDDNTAWLLSREDGLFLWNFRTGTLAPVPLPIRTSPDAIFSHAGGLLIKEYDEVWGYDGTSWEMRSQGEPLEGWDRPWPPVAVMDSGLLLPAVRGILFLPQGREPARLLGWAQGQPLRAPAQILALGGDRFAAISNPLPRWLLANLEDFLNPPPAADVLEIFSWRGWAVDDKDRVYTVLRNSDSALTIFEGRERRQIPFPPNLKTGRIGQIEVDRMGRVWVICGDPNLPVAVLNPDDWTWATFPGFNEALLANRDRIGGLAADADWMRPIPGPEGKMAYRTPDWRLIAWDGATWRSWKMRDISPSSKSNILGQPFFDAEGRLSINGRDTQHTFKWEGGQWRPHPRETGVPDYWADNTPRHSGEALPPGFRPGNIRFPQVLTDNQGVKWVAGDGRLFKYADGKTVAVFPEGAMQPFLSHPGLDGVRVDKSGNAWLRISGNHHVMVPSRVTAPDTIRVNADPWGELRVQDAPSGSAEWRISGNEWQRMTPDGPGFFPQGTHTLEFRFLTDALDRLGPYSRPLTVSISPDKQIPHLISLLASGPDDRRAAAVTGLARQPARALPALRLALKKSPGDWWLRVAIQEAEAESAPGTSVP